VEGWDEQHYHDQEPKPGLPPVRGGVLMAKDKVTVAELLRQRLVKRTHKVCDYCGHRLIIETATEGMGLRYFCPTCSERWRKR
jgi:hypothetical protein